jgi:cytochrome c-type biogenesis protein CcmH/NrfG
MIFSLLTLPIDGFKFILRTLVRTAEEQWTDDAPLKERLLELQVLLDQGDITEEQYVEAEAEILRELRAVRNRKRELAGLPPEEAGQVFTGVVKEGSGASLTYEPQEEAPQFEVETHLPGTSASIPPPSRGGGRRGPRRKRRGR